MKTSDIHDLVALDIGSTVVKCARASRHGNLQSQTFLSRDFKRSIASQVNDILSDAGIDPAVQSILICSSANGGLLVGIVALSQRFSGAVLRNQVLLAGANPVYVHSLDTAAGDARRVDILLVGGGIDDADAAPASDRFCRFDPGRYPHAVLVYCGNRHLAAAFVARHPATAVIDNPLGQTLSTRLGSVFEYVRRAYLDDLVHKEGLSELPATLTKQIRPTPEVVSRGFLRAVLNQSSFTIVGSCVAIDIGGATTDLHYTVEIIATDSEWQPPSGISVGRYVFTDLGVVVSKDTLMQQLRSHSRLFEFLCAVQGGDVRDLYASIREGDHVPAPELLSYACVFMALDRFRSARGPGLPRGRIESIAQLILTGGAAQTLNEAVVTRLVAVLVPPPIAEPLVQVDRRYEIWVAGITWEEYFVGSASVNLRRG